MANSIDWTVLGLGALVGVGCRKQLKAAARVAATTAASLASATAVAVNSAAASMYDQEADQSSEAAAGNGKKGK